MSTMAPPVKAAAAKATSTPVFPRPASTGFELWDPSAHTMAAMTSPATLQSTRHQLQAPLLNSVAHDHKAKNQQNGSSNY